MCDIYLYNELFYPDLRKSCRVAIRGDTEKAGLILIADIIIKVHT